MADGGLAGLMGAYGTDEEDDLEHMQGTELFLTINHTLCCLF